MVILLQLLIRLYQRTLSPDHGWTRVRYPYGFCRFYPSCSEYAYQALERHGLILGIYLSVKRVARCNPWAKPQIDQVI